MHRIPSLTDLYESDGDEDDVLSAPDLSDGAFAVASSLFDNGATAKRVLRTRLSMPGREFDQAVAELGRRPLITNFGVEDGPGWASCVLELTSRVFTLSPHHDRTERDARTAGQFISTMITAQPGDLCRAFGWSRARAAEALAASQGRR